MATTNSTSKGLNKYYYEKDDSTLYGSKAYVNTGNIADYDLKISGNKYVTGKIKNTTYTMSTSENNYEEIGTLLNYDDPILISASNTGGDDTEGQLNTDTSIMYVYGNPNKWVYDLNQIASNCGVASALNILSIAGKIDIVNANEQKINTLFNNNIDTTSTEQALTLYAIQHNYCNHSKDISEYKTVNDIEYEDGGTYFENVNPEDHTYHDPLQSIKSILSDYGITSNTVDLDIMIQGNEDYIVEVTDVPEGESPEDLYTTYTIRNTSGFVKIDSKRGEDTIIFEDNTKEELEEQPFLLIKDGKDLAITYNSSNYVRIVDYFKDKNDIGGNDQDPEQQGGQDDKTTHIKHIQFSDGTSQTLESFVKENYIYESSALQSNIRKYGVFITKLADYVKEGRGIVLEGYAKSFIGGKGGGHAIVLTGVAYKYLDKEKTIFDIDGFYVADSGRWLGSTEKAQYISCSQLYNFVTDTTYLEPETAPYETTFRIVLTDDNIKSWADDLNLVGNDRRNTLYGNNSDNIIRGGGSTDNIYGRKGDDTLYGDNGDDYLYGEDGNNTLYGGNGNDTYVFKASNNSNDTIIPGSGKDILRFEDKTVNNLKFFNKNGDLQIHYGGGTNTVTVKDYFNKSLYSQMAKIDDVYTITLKMIDGKDHSYSFYEIIRDGQIQYDIAQNIDNNVKGTNFDDVIRAGIKNDTIKTGNGNDTVIANAGNNIIDTGAGNDILYAGYGNDKFYGGAGENYIKYEANYGGCDTVYSGKGNDYIELTDKERGDLKFIQVKKDLSVVYDAEKGSSITITNYFAQKGKTSVKYIKLKNNDYLDLVREYNTILTNTTPNVDIKSSGVISGDIGNDVLKGSTGNDTITGGLGCDKMSGMGGNDTFVFNSLYDGDDIIYTTGNGNITLNMTAIDNLNLNNTIGFNNGYQRYNIGDKNYAFSKSGNSLVINYGKTLEQEGLSRITIDNYFKSKNTFTLKTSDAELNLADATIFIDGASSKTKNISGTKQNDIIFGGDLAETIKAGNGDDTIIAGKGNDTIYGEAGHNKFIYNFGDGVDTVNLTKGENLDIILKNTDTNVFNAQNITYTTDSKNNLLINYNGKQIISIKNFANKDVTGETGSVKLYVENALVNDLRNDLYLSTYNNFSSKKLSYTGNWHSEKIDASGLAFTNGKSNTGVKINGNAGNDIIIGSVFNDTLKGGAGNDTITGNKGTNSIDGEAGSDTYILFKNVSNENTTIKDTGKDINDTDKAVIYTDKDNLKFVCNITKNGTLASNTFNVTSTDYKNNKAVISNVETIQATSNGNTYYNYDYTNAELLAAVSNWLSNNDHSYIDVNTALDNATITQQNELLAILATGWQEVV